MKHTQPLLPILGLALFLISCSKMGEQTDGQSKASVLLGGAGVKQISGEFLIAETCPNSVLIFVKSEGAGNGGAFFDKAFVLVSENPLQKLTAEVDADMEVLILKNRKVLSLTNKKDGVVHLLATSDMVHVVDSIKTRLVNEGVKVGTVNYGYGLSFLQGVWNKEKAMHSNFKQPFNILDDADVKLVKKLEAGIIKLSDDGNGENLCALGNCTSGGAGAVSCSLTEPGNGCEVTCSSGYYACCNASTVRCFCCKIQ